MLQPSGFSQQSIVTSLGTLVYYTAEKPPWLSESATRSRPTLVFLHGFGGGSSAYEWSKVYPAFAFDYRILAPDLLGWGRSEHLSRDYEIEDYLVTLRQFIEQTCAGEPVTVVASSLTAGLIIQVAIEYPHLFKSLILSAPSGLADFGKNYRDSFFAKMVSIPVFDRFFYSVAVASNAGISGFLRNRQFARANRISQEMIDAYLASAQLDKADWTALSFVRGDLCFDLEHFVPKLTVPTAIVWGKQAQLTEYTIGQKLMKLNPEAIRFLEVLEDVGLTPQLEVPAVMIGLVRRFLKALDASPVEVSQLPGK
jgi:pimeloyl-ACP methyl ester carboxylesterase